MEEIVKNNSFLGKGWSFPPAFSKGTGTVDMVEGEMDVKSSLEILLTTHLGERILHPDYGCNLFTIQFDTMSPSMQSEVSELVESAINKYEPRIDVESVSLIPNQMEGKIEINIEYIIIQTNTAENLVFPFYLNEGITTL